MLKIWLDEPSYTCDTCNLNSTCPTTCGDYTYCGPAESFECDNGNSISYSLINDGWCDCLNCEDEQDWTCCTCTESGECDENGVECTGGNSDNCDLGNQHTPKIIVIAGLTCVTLMLASQAWLK